jgi:hypothetical protein
MMMSYLRERFGDCIPKHLTEYLKNRFLKQAEMMHIIILRRKRVHQQNIKQANKLRNIKHKGKKETHATTIVQITKISIVNHRKRNL